MKQRLSSAGYSGEGRLARQLNTNKLEPILEEFPPLAMFASGWRHNLFLTREGEVYVNGVNIDGQLGPDTGSCILPKYSESLSALEPVMVCCGDKTSVLLSGEGKAYALGAGWGPQPVHLETQVAVVYIAAGVNSIAAIGEGGEFYYWASANAIPYVADNGIEFCDCAVGLHQVFALAVSGVLYAMGKSKACGQGKQWSSARLMPVMSLDGIPMKRVFAYFKHSVAISEAGSVYSTGSNIYGQLGIGALRKVDRFTKIDELDGKNVVHVAVGDTFTAFLTKDYELYTCGDGDEFRLCNSSLQIVRVPVQPDLVIGRKIQWVACGCAHIIIGEGMKEISPHLGRMHFGLDLPQRRREAGVCPIMRTVDGITCDVSRNGMVWSGFKPGDAVMCGSRNGRVIGMHEKKLVVAFDVDGGRTIELFDAGDVVALHERLKRMGCTCYTSRAGGVFPLDERMCQAFGFEAGDIVNHKLLGDAKVAGVFGNALWLAFDSDAVDGQPRVSTVETNAIEYYHENLRIVKPAGRTVAYMLVDEISVPVETMPCKVLSEYGLAVGDLVLVGKDIGPIVGTFCHKAVVSTATEGKCITGLPVSIKLLRSFSNTPKYVTYRTISGAVVDVNVSCAKGDSFLPFDRIVMKYGHGTYIGKHNGVICVLMDDVLAAGGGIAKIESFEGFKLVRRIAQSGYNYAGLNVSTTGCKRLLPGDVCFLNKKKSLVLGRNASEALVLRHFEGLEETVLPSLETAKIDMVFRADLPATRFYFSRTKNGINFSVSSSSFVGTRVLPDDVISTPKGVGLVVGEFNGKIGVHLGNGDIGVSFFPYQAVYDTKVIKVMQRRAVLSSITSSL